MKIEIELPDMVTVEEAAIILFTIPLTVHAIIERGIITSVEGKLPTKDVLAYADERMITVEEATLHFYTTCRTKLTST